MSNLSYYSYSPEKETFGGHTRREPKRRYLIAILLLATAALIGYGWHRVRTDNMPGQSKGTLVIAGFPFSTKAAAAKPKLDITSKMVTAWEAAIAGRSGLVDIAVYDHTTGETAHYSNTGDTFNSASVEKLSILEGLLLNVQEKGRGLTSKEQSLATSMIEESDNDAATALWNEIGGPKAMTALLNRVGTTRTKVAPGGQWGLTQTTADDQLKIINQVAYSSDFLNQSSRDTAFDLLNGVVASQAWGVTAGLPADASIQLKNGWLPDHGTGNRFNDQNTWTVNSVGHVREGEHDYTIAVLTMGNPTEDYGIQTIEALSAVTWNTFTAMPKS